MLLELLNLLLSAHRRLVLVLVAVAAELVREVLGFLMVLVDSHIQVILLVVLSVHLNAVVLVSINLLPLVLLLVEEMAVIRISSHISSSVHIELVWSLARRDLLMLNLHSCVLVRRSKATSVISRALNSSSVCRSSLSRILRSRVVVAFSV